MFGFTPDPIEPAPCTDAEKVALRQALVHVEEIEAAGASIADLTEAILQAHRLGRFTFKTVGAEIGEKVCRARKVLLDPDGLPIRFSHLDKLGYPPPQHATVGRLNAPGEPMFYGAFGDFGTCLYELGAQVGDWFALQNWEVTERLMMNHMGFSQEIMHRLKDARDFGKYTERFDTDDLGQMLTAWQSKIFTRHVPNGSEHLYRLSNALTKFALQETKGGPEGWPAQFSGLIYPSVALNLLGDNMAILPDVADISLTLTEVRHVRVNAMWDASEVQESGKEVFNVTMFDVAYSCDDDGQLNWQTDLGDFPMPVDIGYP